MISGDGAAIAFDRLGDGPPIRLNRALIPEGLARDFAARLVTRPPRSVAPEAFTRERFDPTRSQPARQRAPGWLLAPRQNQGVVNLIERSRPARFAPIHTLLCFVI